MQLSNNVLRGTLPARKSPCTIRNDNPSVTREEGRATILRMASCRDIYTKALAHLLRAYHIR